MASNNSDEDTKDCTSADKESKEITDISVERKHPADDNTDIIQTDIITKESSDNDKSDTESADIVKSKPDVELRGEVPAAVSEIKSSDQQEEVQKKAKKKKKKKNKKNKPENPENDEASMEDMQDSINKLTQSKLHELMLKEREKVNPKEEHKFWKTQPVILKSNVKEKSIETKVKTETVKNDGASCVGEIKSVTVDEIRAEPYTLQEGFHWDNIDIANPKELDDLFELLYGNYVEDDDHMFRFAYSKQFLLWALHPPGWKLEYLCGVRVKASGKLVAFISAVPAHIKVRGEKLEMVEINYLCVHEKLRNNRVAPVMIKEITRRANRHGIFQAVFTSGTNLPNKPVSVCRYWHRSLNPKKLIDVEFSYLTRNMTLSRSMKLYKLPEQNITPGIRKFKGTDAEQVAKLLNSYLAQFDLHPFFNETEVKYWFLSKDKVIYSWVIQESPEAPIKGVISFYSITSTIMRHQKYTELYTAYSFYQCSNEISNEVLMLEALILAKMNGFDVFNALDVMGNSKVFEKLKFGIGDGNLQYYLYNWDVTAIPPEKIGLVLQ